LATIKTTKESLRGRTAFTKVISCGEKLRRKPITCFFLRTASSEQKISVGFAVSKSVKRALERNKLKRLMKEAFRANEEEFLGKVTEHDSVKIIFVYTQKKEGARKHPTFSTVIQAFSELHTMIK
jgi:ribonuclease P protein component